MGSIRDPSTYDQSLNPFGDDDDEADETNQHSPQTPPPQPERLSLNPFLKVSVKKKAAPSPPPTRKKFNHERAGSNLSNTGTECHFMDYDETDAVTSDDPTVTSGATNENLADAEAPPVVIVSDCL